MTKVIEAFNNPDLWPTPKSIAAKMMAKVQFKKSMYDMHVLEPSAGKGDLIEHLNRDRYNMEFKNIKAIEIDPDLRATLIGKRIKVIDQDFLQFAGPDKFDLIIANPPFSAGDKHLLKAIDIMYCGQIIFLLNAETLRNPHTATRKELVQKLAELNADIEYIEGAFKDAERRTNVEVALIDIMIERKVEDDLFGGGNDKAKSFKENFVEPNELTTGKRVPELVAEYNQIVGLCTQTIVEYFKNYRKVGRYVSLNDVADKHRYCTDDITTLMQRHVNDMLEAVRKEFWRKTLDLPEVQKRMTSKKVDEFNHKVEHCSDMDFTEHNIRTFVLNLIATYEDTLIAAVLEIFDLFSNKHAWDGDNPNEKNVHYFNGWKTNKSWKVGKKVIIPIHGSYGDGPFTDWHGAWKLHYEAEKALRDIDTVMNYFDGMSDYRRMSDDIALAFQNGFASGILSTYFKITCHKKGTVHLTFLNDDILRRFNVVACRGKNWLPPDYGVKPLKELSFEERALVESFEGPKSYSENVKKPLFAAKIRTPQIEYAEVA